MKATLTALAIAGAATAAPVSVGCPEPLVLTVNNGLTLVDGTWKTDTCQSHDVAPYGTYACPYTLQVCLLQMLIIPLDSNDANASYQAVCPAGATRIESARFLYS